MGKIPILAAVLGGLLLISTAQTSQPQAQPPNNPTPNNETGPDVDALHSLRRATVSLGLRVTESGRVRFATVGSGVIITWDRYHGCLLTAKHVFFNPDQGYTPTMLYLRIPQNEPRADDDLGVPLVLVENGRTLWRGADDADLAVISLPDISRYPDLHGFGLEDFGDESDIYQGATVVVFGYPDLLGSEYQTTPIARSGTVAWTNPNGHLTHTFLVDANVFSGNSGGPVFHIPTGITRDRQIAMGGKFKLIGIISKGAAEEAPVHAGPLPITSTNRLTGEVTPITARVLNIGGIGIVEPAPRAKKLIMDSFDTKPQTNP